MALTVARVDYVRGALTRYAERAGFTAAELASYLGVRPGTLDRLGSFETPNTLSEVRRLAALFRIDPSRLAEAVLP